MLVRLLGYAPDADPTIVGVLTNASGVVPSLKGLKGAPTPADPGMATLAATCVGSALLTKLDGSTRLVAGTPGQLYEAGASTWTNVSQAATYTTGTTARWRFAQQENVSFAVNGADTMQASVSSGPFSCIAGAPIASIVETVNKFVFAINTSTGSNHLQWCALGDYTSWTANAATQAASDTLEETPGGITAGRRFGNALAVFKRTSMFLGIYVGKPNVWEFTHIPGDVGALSQEAVVNIGTPENPKLIFMGADDFYVFDGSKPVRIGTNRVKEEVFGDLVQSRSYAATAMHDRKNGLVYFYYPTSDSTIPDKCRVYNYLTDKWGVDDRSVEATTDFVAAAVTYDTLGALYATYNDFPSLSYDVAFRGATQTSPAIFNTSHEIQTMTGPSGTTRFTTGDYGDDSQFNLLLRVRPRFITKPTTARMTNYYRNNTGDSLSTDSQRDLSSGGAFDVTRDARWHRVEMEFTGDWEMSGISPEWERTGLE